MLQNVAVNFAAQTRCRKRHKNERSLFIQKERVAAELKEDSQVFRKTFVLIALL